MKLFRLAAVFAISILIIADSLPQHNMVIQKGEKFYAANTVVMKLREAQRQSASSDILQKALLSNLLSKEGVTSSRYLLSKPVENNSLSNVLILTYSSNKDPEVLAAELSKSDEVEWCEPKFIYKTDFIPSDSSYAKQYALSKIKAAEAWDITKGDTSVVIAIIDTGVDWDHPDLTANIWKNWDETPGNGVDDDGNGFTDDFLGWDFGGLMGIADNDPMEDKPDHGTHVAGIASAVTDNVTGISSIGFNSKIMAVKTSRNDVRNSNGQALIYYGYEGILYAADNGAKVINLSWGGAGYSVLGQEVIDYAVSKGALIVAAAGNDNTNSLFFPSSYIGVLSVASTGADDKKSSFSNYGASIDVSAPGSIILSTWQNNIYANASGTSMASPLVAGLAALVWQQFPSYNPLQIAEQIRVNSDDIYSVNGFYRYLLGKGRVNAFNAVNNKASVAVRAENIIFSDDTGDNDGIMEPGETISLSAQFINLLNTVENLVITLESSDIYSTILNGSFDGGTRGTLEEFNNQASKFTIQLSNTVPQNTEISLRLDFSSANYTDFQLVKILVNPSYADHSNGKILLTVGSEGTLGFIDSPNNSQGNGFSYAGSENLLFEGALILGTSSLKISDAARNADTRNYDFTTLQPFILNVPGEVADQQGSAVFNDDEAGSSKIGVTVNLNTYSYSNELEDDFMILRYTITNNSASNITGLYAGLFFDWDFADATGDLTAYDDQGKLGHVHRILDDMDVWVAAASGDILKGGFYAIRNDGTQGDINLFDANTFSDAEKWQTISGGLGVQSTGPGDVSHVINNGPYNILPGEYVEVPFIVAGGKSLDDLRTAVNTARIKYNSILDAGDQDKIVPFEYSLSQNYPNPFNPSTKIEFTLAQNQNVMLSIFNILGEESAVLLNKEIPSGKYSVNFDPSLYNLAGGVYIYEIKAGDFHSVKKMIYLK